MCIHWIVTDIQHLGLQQPWLTWLRQAVHSKAHWVRHSCMLPALQRRLCHGSGSELRCRRSYTCEEAPCTYVLGQSRVCSAHVSEMPWICSPGATRASSCHFIQRCLNHSDKACWCYAHGVPATGRRCQEFIEAGTASVLVIV